jgi:hypothetical protein
VDLSLDEEEIFPDTLRDDDFATRLFGDLNHGLLGPPSDGKVTIISDSDEEEEVREEDAADADVALPSAVKTPAPTASTADVDDAAKGTPNGSNDGRSPNQAIGASSNGEDKVGSP